MPRPAVRTALAVRVTAAVAASLTASLPGSLTAQCPPGASMSADTAFETAVPTEGQAFIRWQTGKDALAKNDLAAARTHLLAALEFHPASVPILVDLLLASRGDADQLALHADRFARAVVDARGQAKIDAAHKKQMSAVTGLDARIEQARVLTQLRVAAVTELARSVDRSKPSGNRNAARAILARWASEALSLAARGAPAQLGAVAANVDKTQRAFEPDQDFVVQSLARVMRTKAASPALPTSTPAPNAEPQVDRSLRAARILVGLQRQGGHQNVLGTPARKFDAIAEEAAELLEAHAASLAAAKVWSIAELDAMTPAQRVAFTDAHANWRTPGIALSASGRYRIETCCGHATLLAAAQTIERHHARLAAHFGSDPFEQRPGLVRIVPESADLETEGAPYWWAGGFQAGDRTTVRFAWNDVASLGHDLTHELTHRFDQVLRPFLPSWYLEGHAEWAGKHYAKISDTAFTDDHLDIGVVARTYYRGWADAERFETLLKDAIPDYRDNYSAGYSLYSFLRSWPRAAPHYRSALAAYEKNARGGQKDPVGWFTKCFCDGAAGRPGSLAAFVTEWETYLRGCYEWLDDRKKGNEWVGEFGALGDGEHLAKVDDAPTWSWARARNEPWFGQDHAAAATLLLHEAGDAEGTIAAGVWSLTVDGWRPDTCRAVLAALTVGKANDVTAAFAALVRQRFPALSTGTAASPLPKPLQTLLDGLAARSTALVAEDCKLAAAALASEHDQLAQLCGKPPLPKSGDTATTPPPRHLGEHGFVESDLVDYEERRAKGLWYVGKDGDLHVGRERPRDGTGAMDREAQQRDAFVRTIDWQRPGAWVLRGRIQFTTSHARGALVFGHSRRDRDLRLRFSAGNQRYAAGKTEQNEHGGHVHLSLVGMWERDGEVPDTGALPAIEMKDGVNWFDFVLHVNGPRVIVEIDGKPVLRYAIHDGSPIEGAIGFAVSTGAIRVQQATVQRLDGVAASGLDLATAARGTLDDLLMLPVQGVPPSRHGTFVLLLPKATPEEMASSTLAKLPRYAPQLLAVRNAAHEYPQSWVLAAPRDLPEAQRTAALDAMRDASLPPMPVVEHDVTAPFDGTAPWVLFVDGAGLLRAAAPITESRWEFRVKGWARKFRGR